MAALIVALTRPDSTEAGRRVDVGLSTDFTVNQPVLFPADHFYLVRIDDGSTSSSMRAFYSVVPGFFGLERGCEVRWHADQTYEASDGTLYQGIYSDGCGGSEFAVDGTRLFGPAPGDLYQFYVTYAPTGRDHLFVDTRLLSCNVPPSHPEVLNQCRRTLVD